MIQRPNSNRPFNRRGFSSNGMPTGYGQQRGHSIFLDREEPDPTEVDFGNLQPRFLASAPGQAQPQMRTPVVQESEEQEPPFIAALRGSGGDRVSTMPVRFEPTAAQAPQPKVAATPSAQNASSEADFMQHAGRFAPNPSGLNALMSDAAFRERFPNARIHKNDWVDPGDGSGLIDTVRGFNTDTNGGEAWQWLTEADALASAAPQANAPRMAAAQQFLSPLESGEDDIASILDYLLAQDLL